MTPELVKYLSDFVTERRVEQFNRVLEYRTRYASVILEDIYQPHNASAVLRSCDCLGIQDVHIIENNNKFNVEDGVALGSSKWLTLHKYPPQKNNTISVLESMKQQGYRIVATTLHTKSIDLDEFDIENGKFALLFGTELTGLTPEAISMADEYIKIPMFGFTESFNISVSAAIILHFLTHKLFRSSVSWKLSEEEIIALKYEWLMKTIKQPELIVKRFELGITN